MRNVGQLLIAMVIAVLVGLGSTDFFLRSDHPIGTSAFGQWFGWPSLGLGTQEAQDSPYLQAHTARAGLLPLGVNEGILLKTQQDSTGQPLTRNCTYQMESPLPRSYLWTLTPTDIDGGTLPSKTGRSNITSDHLLRDRGGQFRIVMSRTVQPGNWLPLGTYQIAIDGFTKDPLPRSDVAQDQPFVLSLRIYGASLSLDNPSEDLAFPPVTRLRCD